MVEADTFEKRTLDVVGSTRNMIEVDAYTATSLHEKTDDIPNTHNAISKAATDSPSKYAACVAKEV